MKKVYLIDLENVKNAGLDGVEQLSKEESVVIFYSNKADTLKIDTIKNIRESEADVDYIKADNGTPNALDFQLLTYLYYHLVTDIHEMSMQTGANLPLNANPSEEEKAAADDSVRDIQYWIISKDTGYEASIRMSKRLGLTNIHRAPAIKNAIHYSQRAEKSNAARTRTDRLTEATEKNPPDGLPDTADTDLFFAFEDEVTDVSGKSAGKETKSADNDKIAEKETKSMADDNTAGEETKSVNDDNTAGKETKSMADDNTAGKETKFMADDNTAGKGTKSANNDNTAGKGTKSAEDDKFTGKETKSADDDKFTEKKQNSDNLPALTKQKTDLAEIRTFPFTGKPGQEKNSFSHKQNIPNRESGNKADNGFRHDKNEVYSVREKNEVEEKATTLNEDADTQTSSYEKKNNSRRNHGSRHTQKSRKNRNQITQETAESDLPQSIPEKEQKTFGEEPKTTLKENSQTPGEDLQLTPKDAHQNKPEKKLYDTREDQQAEAQRNTWDNQQTEAPRNTRENQQAEVQRNTWDNQQTEAQRNTLENQQAEAQQNSKGKDKSYIKKEKRSNKRENEASQATQPQKARRSLKDEKDRQENNSNRAANQELALLLAQKCSVTDSGTVNIIEDALRSSENKSQFYQYFRRKMGASKGSDLYRSIRDQFSAMKELIAIKDSVSLQEEQMA